MDAVPPLTPGFLASFLHHFSLCLPIDRGDDIDPDCGGLIDLLRFALKQL
jgi:hypothetical protein